MGAPLKAALETAPRLSPVILLTSERKPWTPDGFRASFAKARARAGIVGVTFNDLRGTAVTRLALAGATEAEIATITGHSLRDVRSILDSNYLHRDPALGRAAIHKLERGTKISQLNSQPEFASQLDERKKRCKINGWGTWIRTKIDGVESSLFYR